MSIMETTQDSLLKTVEGVKDAQTLEKAITTPTLGEYSVSTKYQKKLVNLADWMQTAKRLKFLEQVEKKMRGSLNEELAVDCLLEALTEEFEESVYEDIVMEHVSSYDFRRGDEVIEGMLGNLDDKEFDYQVRYLTRIAKKLGLKDVKDLVMFCDAEWMYDPTMFDNRFFTLPENPTEFDVNGVSFIAAKERGDIWLYFRSESDGDAYLGYCDARA